MNSNNVRLKKRLLSNNNLSIAIGYDSIILLLSVFTSNIANISNAKKKINELVQEFKIILKKKEINERKTKTEKL